MDNKARFIKLMIEADVLKFGEFKTKSGRISPYFINTGKFNTGKHIALLGEFYADMIMNELPGEFDFLYGPAYKGISLVCATSIALFNKYNIEVPYSFNRKEAKDHGEGGVIVSYQPKDGDRAVIVEDVITAGTSVRESVPLLRASADVVVNHMVISCDRKERGYNGKTAVMEINEEFGIETHAIVNVYDIVETLQGEEPNGTFQLDENIKTRMMQYMELYCEASMN